MKNALHFLLLEDSPLDAEFLLQQLLEGGLDCTFARVETQEEFTAALEQTRFDAILADYSLPTFNGMAALAIAQERFPDIPFIFVSGRLGEELAIESLKKGATDYVVKHRLERLAPAVSRAISEAQERAERKRVERSLAVLSEASIVLASSLDYQTTLGSIARLAVPHFADFCVVDILTENGGINRLDVAHMDPQRQTDASQLLRYPPQPGVDTHPLPRVLRTGVAELVTDLDAVKMEPMVRDAEHLTLMQELGVRAAMFVPLEARGRVLGAMTFVSCQTQRTYTQVDLALAQDLARRAALAVDNAQLHQKSVHAVRMRDEFLATVSHELRTPLNAILGWVGLLRSDALQGGEASQALETIERNARAQAKLIEDLLDVSRIISGKLTIVRQPVDLHEIVEAVLRGVQPTARAKNVTCRLVPSPGHIRPHGITGDAQRLQQIVWNLVSNGVKFNQSGGVVEVEVCDCGAEAVIRVSDSGPGISPEFLPYVFERFQQADGTSTRRHGGLGLGLAIVRHLAELHGGSVDVESPGRLGGATFEVRLPRGAEETQSVRLEQPNETGSALADAATVSKNGGRPGSDLLAGIRVLVVDDDDDSRNVMAATLRRYGAEVTTAHSAASALLAIESRPFDALLSDIGMPGEDGYRLMQLVKAWEGATGGRLPAAAVTAYTRELDRERARSAGFQIHLAKPLEPRALADVVLELTAVKA